MEYNERINGKNGRFPPNGRSNQGSAGDSPEDEIDLKQLFFTLLRYKWTITGVVLFTTILAGILAFSLTPIYQSEGSLMITESQKGGGALAGSDLANLLTTTYGIGMGSTVSNELQILRSRKLSNELAEKLLDERRLPDGNIYPLLLGEDSTIVYQDTVAKRIREKLEVSQVDREADLVSIRFESPSPVEAARVVNYVMDTYTDISTGQNRMMAQSALEFLEEEGKKVEQRLNQAEEQLRQFMNEQQLIQVDAQTEELIKRLSELETERQTIRVKLAAANSAIEKYEQRLNNLKPGLAEKYADAIAPTISRYQYQVAELKTQRMLLLSKNPELKEYPERAPELQQINNETESLQNEIRKLTNEMVSQGDQFIGFIGGADGRIAQDISEIHKIMIELKVEQSSFEAQLDVLDGRLEDQREFFENLPDNIIRLARLKRDVKVSEGLYLTITNQYAEMALWEQTQFGKGRPVDRGFIPEEPVWPNKPLFILVGFVLGGILAAGYVFLNEAMNNKIDGTEKLKSRGYPVLTVIPDLKEHTNGKAGTDVMMSVNGTDISGNLVVYLDSISPVAESFRRLQSNIVYSQPDKEFSTLLVTSSSKGEGKSTVSANLALVLAESGKKVLLADLDLRRPNVHKLFGLNNQPGLTEVLFKETSKEEAVQSTMIDNVDILTAGKRPPNPSGIMQSGGLYRLLKEFKTEYDHLVLDTPPFGIITDSASLMKQVDGVILVSRFNQTEEAQLDHAIEHLEHVNANILGTILTAFNFKKSSDAYSNDYFKHAYKDYQAYMRET